MSSTASSDLCKDSAVGIYRERLTRRCGRPATDGEVYEYMVRKNEEEKLRRGELDKRLAMIQQEREWNVQRGGGGSVQQWQPDDRDVDVDGDGKADIGAEGRVESRVERYSREQREQDEHVEADAGVEEDAGIRHNKNIQEVDANFGEDDEVAQEDDSEVTLRPGMHQQSSQQDTALDLELQKIMSPPGTTIPPQQIISRLEEQPIITASHSTWPQPHQQLQYLQQCPQRQDAEEESPARIHSKHQHKHVEIEVSSDRSPRTTIPRQGSRPEQVDRSEASSQGKQRQYQQQQERPHKGDQSELQTSNRWRQQRAADEKVQGSMRLGQQQESDFEDQSRRPLRQQQGDAEMELQTRMRGQQLRDADFEVGQIGYPRQQQGTDFQVLTNNHLWQAQRFAATKVRFRPLPHSRRQHHHHHHHQSSISSQDADADADEEEEVHHRQPIRHPHPPKSKSYLSYLYAALILTTTLWLLTLLLLWITTSWLGLRPVSISPYRLPPNIPTRLQLVLPARIQKYADSLPLLLDAQYQLTYAHNSYCHSLEAVCQLISEPTENEFYGGAMEVWMSEDKRSCPLPVACKTGHANYNTGSGMGMRHPMVVEWQREMAKLVLEAGDAIWDGVKAGDALLATCHTGTSTLEEAMKTLHTTTTQTTDMATDKSYSSLTSIAWLCGYHTDSQPRTALQIFLFPFCQTIPPLLEMIKLHNADAVDPLWTHKWVVDMNAALNMTFQIAYDTSVQAIQHMDTMKSSGDRCGKAVVALKEKAGPGLSPLATKLHKELDGACMLLQGEGKLQLTRLSCHLHQLNTDMHQAQDMLLPLIVFRPPPISSTVVTNYDNVLVFDSTSDGKAMGQALAMWRRWALVERDTRISKAVQDAATAMAFRNIGKS